MLKIIGSMLMVIISKGFHEVISFALPQISKPAGGLAATANFCSAVPD